MKKWIVCLFLLIPLTLAATGNVDLPRGIESSFYTWNIPLTANWTLNYVLNLTTNTTTDLNATYYQEGIDIYNQTCTTCLSLQRINTTNLSTIAGEQIIFSYFWTAPANPVNFSDVFNTWTRFSHSGASQPANVGEMNAWTYNSTTNRISNPVNTGSYVGFVSPQNYTNYGLEATLKSTNSDDDVIGIVLAYRESGGYQYTLSALRATTGWTNRWWVAYNANGVNASILVDKDDVITVAASGWSGYPSGTKIRAVRTGDIITVITSEVNNLTYDQASQITINLSNDTRLEKFISGGAIGFSAQSQANAFFDNVTISGSTAALTYNLTFSCTEPGCACDSDLACTSGACRAAFNTSQGYCAQNTTEACSQVYNGTSLAVGQRANSFLCSAVNTTIQCSSSNLCQTNNTFFCAENLTWSNASASEYGCSDSDGDGTVDRSDQLKGTASNIVVNTGTASISVTGENNTAPTGLQNVTISLDSSPTVKFANNFSVRAVNLSKVRITKTTTSLIINMTEASNTTLRKTIFVDDNNFIGLCIKDAVVSSISEVSADCTGVNETNALSCIGNSDGITYGNITCIDQGSYFEIQNLTHSAVVGEQAVAASSSSSSSSSSGGGGGYYSAQKYDLTGKLEQGSVTLDYLRNKDIIKYNGHTWIIKRTKPFILEENGNEISLESLEEINIIPSSETYYTVTLTLNKAKVEVPSKETIIQENKEHTQNITQQPLEEQVETSEVQQAVEIAQENHIEEKQHSSWWWIIIIIIVALGLWFYYHNKK